MNKQQKEEYSRTYNQFCDDSPYLNGDFSIGPSRFDVLTDILDRLHRYETSLHTINERWCSEEMSDSTVANVEKREKNIEQKVKDIADKLGFEVTFNGDPRGGNIRFKLPSGRSNNWGGEDWGIYW